MQTFKLDEFNNLIVTGNLATLHNEDATKQDLKTLLRMFNTEYPFDTREGIPYYDLSIRNNKELIKANIIDRVMQDVRVKASPTRPHLLNELLIRECGANSHQTHDKTLS